MSRLTLFSLLARLPGVLRLVELHLGRGDLEGDDPTRTWGGSGSAHRPLGVTSVPRSALGKAATTAGLKCNKTVEKNASPYNCHFLKTFLLIQKPGIECLHI